jgi:hypothetical protein
MRSRVFGTGFPAIAHKRNGIDQQIPLNHLVDNAGYRKESRSDSPVAELRSGFFMSRKSVTPIDFDHPIHNRRVTFLPFILQGLQVALLGRCREPGPSQRAAITKRSVNKT